MFKVADLASLNRFGYFKSFNHWKLKTVYLDFVDKLQV